MKNLNFKGKIMEKKFWLISIALMVAFSTVTYAAIQDFTLSVPSSVVVIKADPSLELIASDNTTVVTSIAFGEVAQGGAGTWSGYLKNAGNVDLHTFSIASSDIGSVGTVTWNIPASGDLGVGGMWPVTISLSVNETTETGSRQFTIQITGDPTVSGPTIIEIHASDPNDLYARTWDVTFDRAMPPYGPGGYHVGADIVEGHASGDTMSIERPLSPGAHYMMFSITQTGGPAYGVYSGTITINGNAYNFSNLGPDDIFRIDFTA